MALLGIVFMGFLVFSINEEMKKPWDAAAEQQLLSESQAPVYPGAILDENMTKAQRGGKRLYIESIPSESLDIWGFYSDQPVSEVMFWYNALLPGTGYTRTPQPDLPSGQSAFYRKGDTGWLVVTQTIRGTAGTHIVLVRYKGLEDEIGLEDSAGNLVPSPSTTSPEGAKAKAQPAPASETQPTGTTPTKSKP
jgi:hypothetical protein